MSDKVKVTLEVILSDLWGADEAFKDGGARAVKELIEEDIQALWVEAEDYGTIKIEVVPA